MAFSFVPLWKGLRYGTTYPGRTWLSIAAILWGLAMLCARSTWDGTAPHYPNPSPLFDVLPRWQWGVIYLVDGILIFWLMVATSSSVNISRFVMSATSALWTVNVVDSCMGLGYFGPGHAAEAALMLCAYWITLRTDITQADRDSA